MQKILLFSIISILSIHAWSNAARADESQEERSCLDAMKNNAVAGQWSAILSSECEGEAESPEYWEMKGTAYNNVVKDYAKAIEYYKKAIALGGDKAELYSRVVILRHIINGNNAYDDCPEAMEAVPDSAEIIQQCAKILRSLQRDDDARILLKKAYELTPEDSGAAISYGVALSSAGLYNEAIALYDEAIARKDFNLFHFNRLYVYGEAGYYEKGLDVANEDLKTMPGDNIILLHKAVFLRKLRRYAEAKEIVDSVRLNPNTPELFMDSYIFEAALIELMQGDFSLHADSCENKGSAEFCDHNIKALELFKSMNLTDSAKITHREPIFHAFALLYNGKKEEAEALLGAAESIAGMKKADFYAAQSVVAYVFNTPRDVENAMRLYRNAVDLSPDFSDIGTVRKLRFWPEPILKVLSEIKQKSQNEDKNKAGKRATCGCSLMAEQSNLSLASLAILMLSLLFVLSQRRRDKAKAR